ncbi:amino acid permease/ SLC12A domain-containing protein [Mrakia frigida]|uniref:amino acid permease/ SLC12A domain-containing protein n=1 Tax=Mrakia frigida TaxID=29902 RepID=UPI003FCC125E
MIGRIFPIHWNKHQICSLSNWPRFTIVGPDYISLMSGEVKSPRKVLPKACRSTTFRLLFFYGLGAFCVGTICASDDPDLLTALKDGGGGAAKSPYVAAMKRMQIPYFGSAVNAGVLISLLSTANTYVYTVSRSLHGLAVAGQAPKVFRTLNRNGVPYIAVIFALCFGCLSYLQVSAGTFRVIGWWVSITTTSQILNWWVMAWTFLAYRRALKAQDLDKGDFRPVKMIHGIFAAWYVIVIVGLTMIFQGYSLFMPGGWEGLNFFFSYAAMFVFLLAGASWKLIKSTKMVKPLEADFDSDIDVITAYEVEVEAEEMGKPKSRSDKIWDLIM